MEDAYYRYVRLEFLCNQDKNLKDYQVKSSRFRLTEWKFITDDMLWSTQNLNLYKGTKVGFGFYGLYIIFDNIAVMKWVEGKKYPTFAIAWKFCLGM